ncbi:hypothetical protein [Tautonia plasticadhaerens]|uniref:ABC transmembrane type-1 domain-containing protein n=1 Tax=Tautonia plasticadhaerens TaxID=2527974 RepID=A0A518H6Q2_9BACT|nr:hypothetical protein [Tautonia plasticadhaerens]QDV36547.1 hypothetical protein ElP_44750 [Tautonia plasticadhaerens]
MIRISRGLGVLLAVSLILGPLVGLATGPVAEFGPSGGGRVSVVPWGLTLSDPFVLTCARNSVAAAVGSVGLGTVVGVSIGRVVRAGVGRRRGAAMVLVRLAAGCHPGFSAVGVVLLAPIVLGIAGDGPGAVDRRGGEAWRWFGLVLSQFGFASAWVAWWTARGLGRIRGDWLLVSAFSGASRGRIWRSSTWPLVRPTVARAAASAFAVVLIEPGAPIILGLRRTLGAQVVASTWMSSRLDWPRAVALACLGLLLAGLARSVLVRWGGPDALGTSDPPDRPPPGPVDRGGRLLRAAAAAWFGAWLLVCLAPALAVFGSIGGSGGAVPIRDLALPVGCSAALGAAASVLAMLTAWPLSSGRWARSASAVVEVMPPLAIGLGLIGLVEVVGAVSGSIPVPTGIPGGGRGFDPHRAPWLLASWGTAVALLPWAIEGARKARRVEAGALQDLARLRGDRRSRSRTLLLAPIRIRRCARAALGVALLAASGPSPGVVLVPMEAFRPIGAWILREPGLGSGTVTSLAAAGLACQMLGVLLLLGSGRDEGTISVSRG